MYISIKKSCFFFGKVKKKKEVQWTETYTETLHWNDHFDSGIKIFKIIFTFFWGEWNEDTDKINDVPLFNVSEKVSADNKNQQILWIIILFNVLFRLLVDI